MTTLTDKPLDVRAFTRNHSAFASEVATNRVLRFRLMRLVELAMEPTGEDELADAVRICEWRLVMGMVAAEVRARAGEAK